MSNMTIYDTIPMQVYFIQNVKKPFEENVMVLLNGAAKAQKLRSLLALRRVIKSMEGLTEPTKENTDYPNTHLMIDARDWYFKHFYHEQARAEFLRAIINSFIILYEYDKPWRFRIDKVLQFVFNRPWQDMSAYEDEIIYAVRHHWREDENTPFRWEYNPLTIGKGRGN